MENKLRLLRKKNKNFIKSTAAQVAVEFLIVFIIFSGFMFYIYGLGVSLAGLQHAEYFGFMVGRSITTSAKKYGSGNATGSPGRTKYTSAVLVKSWYNKNRTILSVSEMQCGLDGTSGYRDILNYGAGVGPNIASTTGVACKVSAPGLLPIQIKPFELAFDVMMGSDISDDHAKCAMSFTKTWEDCLGEGTPLDTEVIIYDNGT